jgi:NAD(P)-dependent dehydrogenase (short-subunit alcohol dehydrogenase family)
MTPKYPLALVTGAAHRLGKTFALTMARNGYAVLLHYRSSVHEVEATAAEIRALGLPAFTHRADLTDESQVDTLFRQLDVILAQNADSLAGFSSLVNSAALMQRANLAKLPAADWDSTLDLNLRAPFLCAQRAFARMDSGLIVNISDIGAQKTWTAFPAYTVSKAALDSLTKVMARSFAPRVRVNAIAPGLALASEVVSPEEWQRLVSRLPLQRASHLEELASALEFLLKNEYITGQVIAVDGGYSLI